jgi:N-dimethylarginine dimethylaminohydrolase
MLKEHLRGGIFMNWPNSILMVSPNGFRVEYAINPFMKDANGQLQKVNSQKALVQWEHIRDLYVKLGLPVEVIPGDPNFPDMVFCANQCFPFLDSHRKKNVVLGRMKSSQRQGEVKHFREWANQKGFRIHEITDYDFEGCGDAIWNFETGEIFGGHGYRTDVNAYRHLERIIGGPVHRLKLQDPNFYHLDTCFAILNGETAAYVEEAFDHEGLALLKDRFKNLVRIKKEEALKCFAGNCFSPNGRDVLLHPGAQEFCQALSRLGFTIHEVDTSEFLKAGGSVFCIKQTLF